MTLYGKLIVATTSNIDNNAFILLRPYQLKQLQLKQNEKKEVQEELNTQGEDKNSKGQQQVQPVQQQQQQQQQVQPVQQQQQQQQPVQQQQQQPVTQSYSSLIIGGHYHSRNFSGLLRRGEFRNIRSLVIGARSFEKSDKFSITEMDFLERVVVYEQSFTERFFINIGGMFSIEKCPKLNEIILGDNTFRGFSRIVFRDLSTLKIIRIGNGVFYSVEECEFSGRNKFI